MTDSLSVLTIGHSNHPIDAFLGLLRQHGVEVVVDARSQPASRFSPQYGRKPLERALIGAGVDYLYMGDALGGRPRAPACYRADGSIDYERVEAQDFYQRGIEQLLAGIARLRVCVLCAEEDPAHCHRRLLITRTLVHRGVAVHHIRKTGALEPEAELAADSRQLSLLDLERDGPGGR
jgi:uncharacterized protein (DUF488 family)